jgi:DNA-binding LacI/PurR family transcriptional regulator
MGVTIMDIAMEAGVSKSTVSLVINGSNLVKLETRYKVLQAIHKLGYVPNMVARALTTSKKGTFGLIFVTSGEENLSYGFESIPETLLFDVSYGINEGLKNTDYTLLTERFSMHDKLPNIVKNKRVDGVFIIGGLFDSQFIESLRKENIYVVIIGRTYEGVDSVSVNAYQVGYLAAKHLLEKGHNTIVYVNGPQDNVNSIEKLAGFTAAFTEDSHPEEKKMHVIHAAYTGRGGYEAMSELWEKGIRPDAVFGGSDGITMGIIRYLYKQGVRIPEDISVMGYEESIITAHSPLALTIIDGHKRQLGEAACLAMLNRMHNKNAQEVSLKLEPTLIERNSVRNLHIHRQM